MIGGQLAPLGLGCARVGSLNNPRSLAESRALIGAALGMGVTVLDTANIYGQGDSERQIGRVLAGRREDAFVVTKAGNLFSARMRMLRPLKPLLRPLLAMRGGAREAVVAQRQGELLTDWRPEALVTSLEGSLRRLRRERVEGFLLHSPPPAVAADPAIAAALAAQQSAGKILHFGVSCDDAAGLAAALEMPGLTLLQLPWHVLVNCGADSAAHIRERAIIVHVREILRDQPGVPPGQAALRARSHPLVGCALLGTTSPAHLAALALPAGEHA